MTTPVRSVPGPVRLAVAAWLTAIGAGVGATLVRLALPEPPTGDELAVRFGIYTALALFVLALRSGRNAVRIALTVLLGAVGLLSLLVDPAGWVAAGGSVMGFLAAADVATWAVVLIRGLHVAAVVVALVAVYRPAANAYFAPRRRHELDARGRAGSS
jgi:hypothetical protein